MRHPQLGTPSQAWTYLDPSGAVQHYVMRFETSRGKEIRPLTLWRDLTGQLGWEWKAAPGNRPLYGLDRLATRPDDLVLVVEGEKAADAAAQLCRGSVVITSSGGASAAQHTDWSPLAGRSVAIWPDNDEPGQRYVQAVAIILRGLERRTVNRTHRRRLQDCRGADLIGSDFPSDALTRCSEQSGRAS
jgi:predicted small integral membrane protein